MTVNLQARDAGLLTRDTQLLRDHRTLPSTRSTTTSRRLSGKVFLDILPGHI